MSFVVKKVGVKKVVVLGVLLAASGLAAAADPTPVVDIAPLLEGITGTSTAIKAILGALISMSVSIFGLTKVYSFIKRKAGA